MYGPTETTVWSTCWQVPVAASRASPIGRPIANTSVWILDAQRPALPDRGAGRDLHRRRRASRSATCTGRELTAERFVPDPFGDEPGATAVPHRRPGRWRHDGMLEHLGRLDYQVKVRGYRIELGEIEAALLGASGGGAMRGRRAGRARGDVRLVAYVVLRDGEAVAMRRPCGSICDGAARVHGAAALGGLARAAVAAERQDRSRRAAGARHRDGPPGVACRLAPETHEEKAIAAIWAELLRHRRALRASDNFFDLGGHSLLAMRAVIAAEKQLGWRIAPRRLVFETLRQVANPAHGKR